MNRDKRVPLPGRLPQRGITLPFPLHHSELLRLVRFCPRLGLVAESRVRVPTIVDVEPFELECISTRQDQLRVQSLAQLTDRGLDLARPALGPRSCTPRELHIDKRRAGLSPHLVVGTSTIRTPALVRSMPVQSMSI